MKEFDLIAAFFKKRARRRQDVVLGIGDDAAAVIPPLGQAVMISTDTLNAGTHFLTTHSAESIGHRAIAVNLSDMAAMGAEPAWVTLSLSLPHVDSTWLSGFCDGFFSLLDEYQISLVGGDITQGPFSMTVTILGVAPPSLLLKRVGAAVGDYIYVTGTLGKASYALQDTTQPASERLSRVSARVKEGISLRGIASAAIDISDGLAQDLSHLLQCNQVGAEITLTQLPLADAPKIQLSEEASWQLALTGGDDYELCFTVPPDRVMLLETAAREWTCKVTRIGRIIATSALRCLRGDGTLLALTQLGYQHFNSEG